MQGLGKEAGLEIPRPLLPAAEHRELLGTIATTETIGTP